MHTVGLHPRGLPLCLLRPAWEVWVGGLVLDRSGLRGRSALGARLLGVPAAVVERLAD
jgi:hypothetical protein